MIGLLCAVLGALAVWLLLSAAAWRQDLRDSRDRRRIVRADRELRMRVEEHMWKAGLYENSPS